MYRKAGPSEQPFMADVTLEVLGLLMLHENLFVIKLSIAIPTQLC